MPAVAATLAELGIHCEDHPSQPPVRSAHHTSNDSSGVLAVYKAATILELYTCSVRACKERDRVEEHISIGVNSIEAVHFEFLSVMWRL